MLRPLDLQPVGEGEHRSGWPYCMAALQPLFSPDAAVLLDDFVERTFLYKTREQTVHQSPWVAMLHHPPDIPDWYMRNLQLGALQTSENWAASEPLLRLIITFGANSLAWCRSRWPQIPSVAIRHPTGQPQLFWSPEAFQRQPNPKILQIGWFLRNMQAIYQAKVPTWLRKAQLDPRSGWVRWVTDLCKQQYGRGRPDIGPVYHIPPVDDIWYDVTLADSIVLMEVISAVANNTVVECIARNTPICINRHPGPVYYLGPDYPLFYDRFEEIESKLTIENIMAAHQYLSRMDKWWLSGEMFREQVRAACLAHVPECR